MGKHRVYDLCELLTVDKLFKNSMLPGWSVYNVQDKVQ